MNNSKTDSRTVVKACVYSVFPEPTKHIASLVKVTRFELATSTSLM